MNSLKNISVLVLVTLGWFSMCQAAELDIYDNSKLIVVRSRGTLQGYYSGSSTTSYISGSRQATVLCEFIFAQVKIRGGAVSIKAWEKALTNPGEDRQTAGALYQGEGHVVVNFQQVPAGCRSKEDGELFAVKPDGVATSGTAVEDQGLHVHKRGRKSVIGIRLIPMGGTLKHDSDDEMVFPRWALVVLIREQSGRSYVRYVEPNNGNVIEGWTLSHLKDPFVQSK